MFSGSEIYRAFTSNDIPLVALRYAFFGSMLFFILLIPLYRSNRSFFDVEVARKLMSVVRFVIIVQDILSFVLLYCTATFGNPFYLNEPWKLSQSVDWIFGFPRPSFGLIFVSQGLFGDMGPIFRIISISASVIQMLTDGISAFFVYMYYYEMTTKGTAIRPLTPQFLYFYYSRDVVSFFLGFLIVLYLSYVSIILGNFPQRIPYSEVAGDDEDRVKVMNENLSRRRNKKSP